jgi:hypothetical protein
MDTLKLDPNTWDLMLDANGNIAVATGKEAIAQDVASQGRLFLGELWYDTTQGLPYFEAVLGHAPPRAFVNAKYQEAGLLVPNTTKIVPNLTFPIPRTRILGGTLTITDDLGNTFSVTLGASGTPWYVSAVSSSDTITP